MTEESLITLNTDDIKEILAEHFKVEVEAIKLEQYRHYNDFGDVNEGILCEVRKCK